jgi:asparagine synthase (glutamine-hydrolysing)
MSIILGSRNLKGRSLDEFQLRDLAQATQRFAPDGTFVRLTPAVGFGVQQVHTHLRSKFESLPALSEHGNMAALDGRLDNYVELAKLLEIPDGTICDSVIALRAFEQWGEKCFSEFIGEWAIALWSIRDETLYLARDHAGTRTLYFEATAEEILWSTYLDTFFARGKKLTPDRGYMIAYLSSRPILHRTPFEGIEAVPAGHFVRFRGKSRTYKAHWNCVAGGDIRYQRDEEYEEHFRELFRRAVERRSGPGAPIVAELSGGMDSTSIVCMSDAIREGTSQSELIDTISYFDDADPDWNERPYFELVEGQRGKKGIHISASFLRRTFDAADPEQATYLFPGADSSTVGRESELLRIMADRPYRVILSGIGGDELLGGVPTPYPELADHLVAGRFSTLFKQSLRWSLSSRRALAPLVIETARFACELYFRKFEKAKVAPPWIAENEDSTAPVDTGANLTLPQRLRLAPSQISARLAWNMAIETLPSHHPGALYRPEYRFPFLDRDLVEFLIAIPREQLIRPGRRRSLMRRALKDIVPAEILERKRKAFQLRAPLAALNSHAKSIESLFTDSRIRALCPINTDVLLQSLKTTCSGATPQYCAPLLKLVGLELCLRSNSMHLRESANAIHR